MATKLRKYNRDLKVLFMSGYTENSVVHHGILDDGMDFIQKPFSPIDFMQKNT